MTKFGIAILACFIAATFVATEASAKFGDRGNQGFCKSGQKTGSVKNCKENGGRR